MWSCGVLAADSPNPMHEALTRAVSALGSQAAMARLCGVSQPAVWKWLTGKKSLPPEHVLAVEAATQITRYDLRPDIYGVAPSLEAVAPSAQSDIEVAR